jgi:hypothetical protein
MVWEHGELTPLGRKKQKCVGGIVGNRIRKQKGETKQTKQKAGASSPKQPAYHHVCGLGSDVNPSFFLHHHRQ